jgi:hypothetical protein
MIDDKAGRGETPDAAAKAGRGETPDATGSGLSR